MELFNFRDPVFLVILSLAALAAASQIPNALEWIQHRVALQKARNELAAAESDGRNQDSGKTVAATQKVWETTALNDAGVNARLREAGGLAQIELQTLTGEDDAALRAAKRRDEYQKKRDRDARVQERRRGNSLSQSDGGKPDDSKPSTGDSSAHQKAASRHREPETPDPPLGSQQEG